MNGGDRMIIGKLDQQVLELKEQLSHAMALIHDLRRQNEQLKLATDSARDTFSGCERCRSMVKHPLIRA